MFTISLPLSVPITKKEKFYLNLNMYRNAHYFTLNKAKTIFEESVYPLLAPLPNKITKLSIVYTLFTGSKRSVDISNICCIVDKFFCDTLVSSGKLPDDGLEIISEIDYRFGSVDKLNPRVEAYIYNIQTQEEPMRVIINQSEIEEAIKEYINGKIEVHGSVNTIEFRAGRGSDGFTAEIDLSTKVSKPEPIKENIKPIITPPLFNISSGEDRVAPEEEVAPVTHVVGPETTSEPRTSLFEAAGEGTALKQENDAVEALQALTGASAPTGVLAGKSLFANLTKVTNNN